MPKIPRFAPKRVGVLAFPDVQLLDVAGPLQVFASANEVVRGAYDVTVMAREERVRSTAGVVLEAAPLARGGLDTLVVAGGRGVYEACEEPRLVRWVETKRPRRLASVCSGAFLLAAAGLLDGRRAVTHWDRCADFARRFPRVRLDPDPIFVRDGNVWTSAGITAGIDLALALVEEDLGHAVAIAVARQLVVFLKRPGGQSQYSAALALQTDDDRFERLHAWIAENLRADLSLHALAKRVHMSARSFSRHYREKTGATPARSVERLRVEAARRMLEEGASVAQTARRAGFAAEETMRRSFLRLLAATPQAYRARWRA